MKTCIIVLLCVSMLLEGCSSYSAISQDDHGTFALSPDRNIRITLMDETEIEVEPYHYVRVEEPATFVYGIGILKDTVTKTSSEFIGKVLPTSCDSISGFVSYPGYSNPLRRYDFSMSDGRVVQFAEGDVVLVDSTLGSGLWICGRDIVFRGERTNWTRIPFEDIKMIEEPHFSITKTGLWVVGVYGGSLLILALFAVGLRKGLTAW